MDSVRGRSGSPAISQGNASRHNLTRAGISLNSMRINSKVTSLQQPKPGSAAFNVTDRCSRL